MWAEVALVCFGALVGASLLTLGVWKLAVRHGLLDVPNNRSSHRVPTPRGGGLAIVLAGSVSLTLLFVAGHLDTDLFLPLTVGGTAVAAVGFLDDRYQLSAQVRLAVHLIAAIGAVVALGGLSPMRFGDAVVHFGWSGYVLASVGIVWTLNLFNFMDGIDGIAASESAFVAAGAVMIALLGGGADGATVAAATFAAACCGFLFWNWPPARIFMGDVGSGYVGYVVAVLAVASARHNTHAIFTWLILGGVFYADATVTLLRRLVRGKRVYQAHRSHAYQNLTRRWDSHRAVTLGVLFLNLIVLLPAAIVADHYPSWAWLMTLLVLSTLSIVAFAAGAGTDECAGNPASPKV